MSAQHTPVRFYASSCFNSARCHWQATAYRVIRLQGGEEDHGAVAHVKGYSEPHAAEAAAIAKATGAARATGASHV